MPELPEVEIIRRQLNDEIVGERVKKVEYDTEKILKPNPQVFINAVKGQLIKKVERKAKLLIFYLGDGKMIVAHLKLSGRLLVRDKTDSPDDYVHAKLIFDSGRELRFAEARKFGFFRLLENEKELAEILKEYGPEPLNGLTKEGFSEILKTASGKIKTVLLDQKMIAGVGNIYANEALWMAKIHPEEKVNNLSSNQVSKLFRALEDVLKEGLLKGGASDQWYRQVHGEVGHYQENFKVYRQERRPCLHCGTLIKRLKVGGRGTFFCPKCQTKNDN